MKKLMLILCFAGSAYAQNYVVPQYPRNLQQGVAASQILNNQAQANYFNGQAAINSAYSGVIIPQPNIIFPNVETNLGAVARPNPMLNYNENILKQLDNGKGR